MFIAALIAADRLSVGDISTAEDALGGVGVAPLGWDWVEEEKACDLRCNGDPAAVRKALEGAIGEVDIVVQPAEGRRRLLLVADMDSTMITVECIDELADYAGLKAEVAAVTERAMRGEIPFEAALADRVALLRGLEERVIDRCYEERVRITPGAQALIRTMRRNGAYCVLVSGGFTHFAEKVAREIGFDRVFANALCVMGGRLEGTVEQPILGAAGKREALLESAAGQGVALGATLAIGDGANDIPMLKAAGLGIAYRAKPKAAAAADAAIEYCDLDALLYAQGYPRKEWVDD